MNQIVQRDGGVTAPAGFRAAGMAAGIKPGGRADLAMVVNDGPELTAAGVFTRNRVTAAPVMWSRQVLEAGRLRAVVLNAGGANACTGSRGFADAHTSAERAAAALTDTGIETGAAEIAICSTGKIGEFLPMSPLLDGIDSAARRLAADAASAYAAADAVRTTDHVVKQASVAGGGYAIGGFTKGAGMVAPSMATMLSVLTTDAVIDAETAQEALRSASAGSFERIDVDGSISTNDTVLLLASGASGHRPEAGEFTRSLHGVCWDLARQMQADAEGVSKEIVITVTGAATEDDAVAVGRAVARDNLVKCAFFGEDPNWGRVAAAAGAAGVEFDPLLLAVSLGGIKLYAGGEPVGARSMVDLGTREVAVDIDLGAGSAQACVLTTDLTHAYVDINAEYS